MAQLCPVIGETIANSVAVFILAGMLLLPLINIFVGAIVGAGVSGAFGFLAGVLLAFLIMVVEIAMLRADDHQLPAEAAQSRLRAVLPTRNLSRVIVNLSDCSPLRMGLAIARGGSSAEQESSEEDRRHAA